MAKARVTVMEFAEMPHHARERQLTPAERAEPRAKAKKAGAIIEAAARSAGEAGW